MSDRTSVSPGQLRRMADELDRAASSRNTRDSSEIVESAVVRVLLRDAAEEIEGLRGEVEALRAATGFTKERLQRVTGHE